MMLWAPIETKVTGVKMAASLLLAAPALVKAAADIIPGIIGLFDRDAGKVAADVSNIAKGIFNTDDPDQINQAIATNPELAFQYKMALAGYEDAEKKRIHELDVKHLEDRMNARARDTAIVQSTGSNTRANVMIVLDAIGLILCLLVLVFFKDKLPEAANTLLTTIASIFGVCLRDAHQFEFGSSRGSEAKTAVLMDQVRR